MKARMAHPPKVLVDGKVVRVSIVGQSRNTRKAIDGAIGRLTGVCSFSTQGKEIVVSIIGGTVKDKREAAKLLREAERMIRKAINGAIGSRFTTAARKSAAPSKQRRSATAYA